MKFITRNQIIHESPAFTKKSSVSSMEIFKQILQKKGEYNHSNINYTNDDTIELKNISSIALHSFVLELERMGKKIVFEKSTTIKIEE